MQENGHPHEGHGRDAIPAGHAYVWVTELGAGGGCRPYRHCGRRPLDLQSRQPATRGACSNRQGDNVLVDLLVIGPSAEFLLIFLFAPTWDLVVYIVAFIVDS